MGCAESTTPAGFSERESTTMIVRHWERMRDEIERFIDVSVAG